jgi:hypothetical protein
MALATGHEHNAWIVGSSDAVIIDPGPRSAAGLLLQSMAQLGVRPARVTHVLLTDLSLDACGNSDLFPNAVVVAQGCVSGSALQRELAQRTSDDARWCSMFDRFADRPGAWDTPAQSTVNGVLNAGALRVTTWVPGRTVHTPVGEFTGVSLPGVGARTMAWMDAHGRLFGGESCNLDVEPTVRLMDAYLESLLVLTRLSPRLILPGSGAANSAIAVAFRSLSLFANNLISNIQYALDGPRTVAELKFRDLGYYPDSQAEFAMACRTLDAALSALHSAGVATRQQDPNGLYRYVIERPNRY